MRSTVHTLRNSFVEKHKFHHLINWKITISSQLFSKKCHHISFQNSHTKVRVLLLLFCWLCSTVNNLEWLNLLVLPYFRIDILYINFEDDNCILSRSAIFWGWCLVVSDGGGERVRQNFHPRQILKTFMARIFMKTGKNTIPAFPLKDKMNTKIVTNLKC